MTEDTNVTHDPNSEMANGEKTSELETAASSNELSDAMTELENMKKVVANQQTELGEAKNGLLMARADFENARKRMERDKQEAIKYGFERLFKDLLPSLDVLDKALSESPSDESAKAYVQGFDMIRKQFYETLEKHGLAKIEASGKNFDPDFHQAIQRVESKEVAKDTVKDVFMQGFTFNGRVIRPAMVSVFVPSGD